MKCSFYIFYIKKERSYKFIPVLIQSVVEERIEYHSAHWKECNDPHGQLDENEDPTEHGQHEKDGDNAQLNEFLFNFKLFPFCTFPPKFSEDDVDLSIMQKKQQKDRPNQERIKCLLRLKCSLKLNLSNKSSLM